MSTTTVGQGRRARRRGTAAALALAVAMLAGCSSSGDQAESGAAMDMVADGAEHATEGGQADVAAEEADEAGPAREDRSLIITGSLYVTVEEPLAAADRAATIVQGAGGRVDAREETAPDGDDGGSASLLLRIPQARLDAVVDEIEALGEVDRYTSSSRDVTTEVTDLEAQIATLRASTDRIRALLVEAEDIGDVIALESELDDRQAELESLEARQRGLDDQIAMSTIELWLTTEPAVEVDDSPSTFGDGLAAGWNALVAFVSTVLVILGVLIPWLALPAIVILVIVLRVRAMRRARRQQADAVTTPAAAARQEDATTGAPTPDADDSNRG